MYYSLIDKGTVRQGMVGTSCDDDLSVFEWDPTTLGKSSNSHTQGTRFGTSPRKVGRKVAPHNPFQHSASNHHQKSGDPQIPGRAYIE